MDGREVRSKFSQEVANQLEEEQVEKLFAWNICLNSDQPDGGGEDDVPGENVLRGPDGGEHEGEPSLSIFCLSQDRPMIHNTQFQDLWLLFSVIVF